MHAYHEISRLLHACHETSVGIAHRLQANSVNLDIKRVVAYRHWCNKLWNAVRFALMNLGEGFQPCASPPQPGGLPMACQWILSRLNAATEGTVSALETYAFSAASQACPLVAC